MTMDQALLHEFEVLDKWMTTMKDRTLYMLMEEREPYYFLPHSKRHDFLEDARIQELLPGWIEWMPVVKSCRKINYQPDTDCLSDASWGSLYRSPLQWHSAFRSVMSWNACLADVI